MPCLKSTYTRLAAGSAAQLAGTSNLLISLVVPNTPCGPSAMVRMVKPEVQPSNRIVQLLIPPAAPPLDWTFGVVSPTKREPVAVFTGLVTSSNIQFH